MSASLHFPCPAHIPFPIHDWISSGHLSSIELNVCYIRTIIPLLNERKSRAISCGKRGDEM